MFTSSLPMHYRWILLDEEIQVKMIYADNDGLVIVRVDRSYSDDYDPSLPGCTTAVITFSDAAVRIDGIVYDLSDDLPAICGIADALVLGPRMASSGTSTVVRNC